MKWGGWSSPAAVQEQCERVVCGDSTLTGLGETRGLGAQEFALAPSADEGDGELVNWAGFDAFEPPPEAAEPDAEGALAQRNEQHEHLCDRMQGLGQGL